MTDPVVPWLRTKLDTDEQLRWWARSGCRLYRLSPLLAGVFSMFALLMAGYCGVLVYEGLTTGTDVVFFAVFGFGLLFSLFLGVWPWSMHRWTRGQLAYAVTNRRGLQVTHRPGKKDVVKSFPAEDINRLIGREYPDGWGNLWIRTETRVSTVPLDISHPVRLLLGKIRLPVGFAILRSGFMDVPDVRAAAEALAGVVDITPVVKQSAFRWIMGRTSHEDGESP